jgi:hypothetical protein
LLKGFELDEAPIQQDISYASKHFNDQTKATLEAAATAITEEAREHDIISDVLVPIDWSCCKVL